MTTELKKLAIFDASNNGMCFGIPKWLTQPQYIKSCPLYVIKDQEELLDIKELDIQCWEFVDNDRNLVDFKISHESLSKWYQSNFFIVNNLTKRAALISRSSIKDNTRSIENCGVITQYYYLRVPFNLYCLLTDPSIEDEDLFDQMKERKKQISVNVHIQETKSLSLKSLV